MQNGKTLIFTIAFNRLEMIKFSILNVVTHAKNARFVIWDNASDRKLLDFCRYIVKNNTEKSLEILYFASKNIGLNAAKEIVEKFSEGCEFIMSVDEDILYLPFNFQSDLQYLLKQQVKPLGYVACNVIQDKLTNGAKPPEDSYQEIDVGLPILIGPTGGWASMTTSSVYQKIGGYSQSSEGFYGLDGLFSKKCHDNGLYTALSKNTICYHATGPKWNHYFNYGQIYDKKLEMFKKSKT
jgi:hypothetical protein